MSTGLRAVQALICEGRIDAARQALSALAIAGFTDPRGLQAVAQLYLHCASPREAWQCHERAVALAPLQPELLFNLATSCVNMGQIDRAEALLAQVIRLAPDDMEARLQRALLRTWTASTHHLDELQALLVALPDPHPGRAPLCYALAKEHEDLGDDALSFQYLQQGAQARRRRLAYRVEADVQAMAHIASVFDAQTLARRAPLPDAPERACFVLGLPRSGTTLVERMLACHSQVGSLGEVESFTHALLHLTGHEGGKQATIERAGQVDVAQLGARYRAAMSSYGLPQPRLINKLPLNYLYLGLIYQALPGAQIIHVRRHPLDSCYAMYKTWFRMGYPFSYSLEDLGHYYLAYERLMAHWRALIPGSFIELDYEDLVSAPQACLSRVLQAGGLAWEDACLDFHQQQAPVSTASAVQVRQPLYRSSVGRWQRHAAALAPLADWLERHGVSCA